MTLRIKTIARLTGIREATLRAWERRYGFPSPARAENGYRTYSREDAEAIRRVARLLQQGYTASEAIDVVRAAPTGSLPERQRLEERFWSAVMVMDQQEADAALTEAERTMEPLAYCDEFLMPLLRRMSDKLDVAREHMASGAVRARLRALTSAVSEQPDGPGILLACPPSDQHEGGLLALAFHLRTHGWRVSLLGADTPHSAIRAACEHGRAALVGVSFVRHYEATEFDAVLRQLVRASPVPIVVGGAAAREHLRIVFQCGAFFADSAEDLALLWQRMRGGLTG